MISPIPSIPSELQHKLSTAHYVLYSLYITNLLRLNRKWITYNRGSNDNFKFSWINYFPTCHNGFRKRLLSIDVRFPSINAKQAIGNIVNMIRKQQVKKGAQMVVGDACPNWALWLFKQWTSSQSPEWNGAKRLITIHTLNWYWLII